VSDRNQARIPPFTVDTQGRRVFVMMENA